MQCCIVALHSLSALGHRLKSTSGTEPPPLPQTSDTASIKSKVAPQLTASRGIDYHSMASTVKLCDHQEGNHHCTERRTSINSLYIVITAWVPLHIDHYVIVDADDSRAPFHNEVHFHLKHVLRHLGSKGHSLESVLAFVSVYYQ